LKNSEKFQDIPTNSKKFQGIININFVKLEVIQIPNIADGKGNSGDAPNFQMLPTSINYYMFSSQLSFSPTTLFSCT